MNGDDVTPCDEVFLVGRITPAGERNVRIIGVFDIKSEAERRCLDGSYFVGPLIMNQPLTRDGLWDGVYFPRKW